MREQERLLREEAAQHPELALYLLRPPVVLGPHTVGGKELLPGPLAPLAQALQGRFRRLPVPVYRIVATRGQAHAQTFEVECAVPALALTEQGEGRSRRIAATARASHRRPAGPA